MDDPTEHRAVLEDRDYYTRENMFRVACQRPLGISLWMGTRVRQQQDPYPAAGARHPILYPTQAEPQQESPFQQEAVQDAPYG